MVVAYSMMDECSCALGALRSLASGARSTSVRGYYTTLKHTDFLCCYALQGTLSRHLHREDAVSLFLANLKIDVMFILFYLFEYFFDKNIFFKKLSRPYRASKLY